MVKSNTTIMIVCIMVVLMATMLPCLEALSPMGAPVMSPGSPTTAPAPAPDCLTLLTTNVTNCLDYVLVGSNLTVPDKKCCPEVAGLLESNAGCLCQLVGQAGSFGVDIKRASMLPSACKLPFPSSVASCLGGSPASAPTPSSPSETPGSTTVSTGPGGAASSPSGSGTGGSNGASGIAVRDLSTLVCLAVAIFIAYYF